MLITPSGEMWTMDQSTNLASLCRNPVVIWSSVMSMPARKVSTWTSGRQIQPYFLCETGQSVGSASRSHCRVRSYSLFARQGPAAAGPLRLIHAGEIAEALTHHGVEVHHAVEDQPLGKCICSTRSDMTSLWIDRAVERSQ